MTSVNCQINTIQLSLRGKGSAFALNPSRDSCVIASPGCLSFYDLNGIGSPRQLTHYEQPLVITKLVYKFGGHVAALRGGVVSIFDPNNAMRPLKATIKPPSSNMIKDVDCSTSYTSLIGVCFDNGSTRIYDSRSCNHPVSNLISGKAEPMLKIKWNTNMNSGHHLAACSSNCLHIWDMRMHNACIEEITCNQGITHFSWDVYGDSNASSSSLLVVSKDNKVRWYNADFSEDSCIHSPYTINDTTFIATMGRRSFLGCRMNFSIAPTLDASEGAPNGILGAPCKLFLVGAPRPINNLESMFKQEELQVQSKGIEIAESADPIIGMEMGEPGRLVPPAQGGMEVILASSSSCLHAIKISSSLLSDYSGSPLLASNEHLKKTKLMQLPTDSDNKLERLGHEEVMNEAKLAQTTNPRDIRTLYRISPKYSVTTLQENHISDMTNRGAPKNVKNISAREFWQKLLQDLLILETLIQKDEMGISIDGVDQNARQITLGMRRSLSDMEPDVVNQNIQVQQKTECEIADIEFILIISFPTRYPSIGAPSFVIRPSLPPIVVASAIMPDTTKFVADVITELNNISRYTQNSYPTSNNPNLYSFMNSSSVVDDKISNISNLLWKVACCFRDRVVQLRNKDSRCRESAYSLKDNQDTSSTLKLSESFIKSVDDENAPLQKLFNKPEYIIEPRAYQVPCPRSSGAVFNGRGTLLCFGGAELNYLPTHKEIEEKRTDAEDVVDKIHFESPLRTYADLLLKLKEGMGMDEGEEKEGIEMGGEEEEEEEDEEEDEDYLKAITNESRAAKDSLTILAAKLDDKEDKKAQAAKKPKGPEIKENESNDNDDNKQRMDISDESGKENTKVVGVHKNSEDDTEDNSTRKALVSTRTRHETDVFSENITSTHPTHLKFHELWTSINLSWFANQYYLGSIQSTHESSNFSTLKGDVFAPEIAQEKAEACRKNAWVAQTVNENAISRLWVLLSVSINSMRSDNIDDSPMAVASITNGSKSWMSSAIGGQSLLKIMKYLQQIGDIQTLATIICILGGCDSCAALLDNCRMSSEDIGASFTNLQSLDSIYLHRTLLGYSEVLRRMGLQEVATEIMKFSKAFKINRDSESHHDLDFQLICVRCHKNISTTKDTNQQNRRRIYGKAQAKFKGNWCKQCADFSLRCSVCHSSVRSVGIFCFSCGHGGHAAHMKSWFQSFSECPAGCGCRCVDVASFDLDLNNVDELDENRIQFADITAPSTSELNVRSDSKGNARDDESDVGSENSDSDDSDGFTPSHRLYSWR